MNLYSNGESLRRTADSMKILGVYVTHRTIENWIKKYAGLMDSYLQTITPKLSEKWRTGEIFLKIKGNREYLYCMMCDKTRYLIAKQVSNRKCIQDVSPLFKNGVAVAGKKPSLLISDGAPDFHLAYKKEYEAKNFLHKETRHIRHMHLKGDRNNNNKMERLNGELGDREKVMRSLKTKDSAIITGMQIRHNFIRGHMGLDDKTPAEASGVRVEGLNKWMTLIQNAKKNRSPK